MIGQLPRECNNGKGMLSSVEQAFVGREEKRAPLKTPAWEARLLAASLVSEWFRTDFTVVSYSFPNRLAHITHRKLQGLRPYL